MCVCRWKDSTLVWPERVWRPGPSLSFLACLFLPSHQPLALVLPISSPFPGTPALTQQCRESSHCPVWVLLCTLWKFLILYSSCSLSSSFYHDFSSSPEKINPTTLWTSIFMLLWHMHNDNYFFIGIALLYHVCFQQGNQSQIELPCPALN